MPLSIRQKISLTVLFFIGSFLQRMQKSVNTEPDWTNSWIFFLQQEMCLVLFLADILYNLKKKGEGAARTHTPTQNKPSTETRKLVWTCLRTTSFQSVIWNKVVFPRNNTSSSVMTCEKAQLQPSSNCVELPLTQQVSCPQTNKS